MENSGRLGKVFHLVKFLFFFWSILLFTPFAASVYAEIDAEYRERAEQFRERLRLEGFQPEVIERLFSDERVVLYPEIVNLTGKGLNYLGRRFGLLKRKSLEQGRRLIKEKSAVFRKIEQSLGVDKEIIVAILRIETNFGRSKGNRPIFNSLLTLALVENRRSQWAENELTQLLRFTGEREIDPLTIKGSWAGAFGLAQFIPSSYILYGMDGDGDGLVDLFSFSDAAWSIANYLQANGWRKNHREENRRAVYSYNHCDNYVDAVFAYATALKRPLRPARRR